MLGHEVVFWGGTVDPNVATKTGVEGIDMVDGEIYERFWGGGVTLREMVGEMLFVDRCAINVSWRWAM